MNKPIQAIVDSVGGDVESDTFEYRLREFLSQLSDRQVYALGSQLKLDLTSYENYDQIRGGLSVEIVIALQETTQDQKEQART